MSTGRCPFSGTSFTYSSINSSPQSPGFPLITGIESPSSSRSHIRQENNSLRQIEKLKRKKSRSKSRESRSRSRDRRSKSKERSRERRSASKEKKQLKTKKQKKKRDGSDDKSTPLTLGELVKLAKEKEPELPKSEASDHEDDPLFNLLPEKPKQSVPIDLPILKEEDIKQNIIINPDPPFDSETMKIKKRASSMTIAPNNYLKSDGLVYSSHDEREILTRFNENVLAFLKKARDSQPDVPLLSPYPAHEGCKCGRKDGEEEESSSSSSSSEDEDDNETDLTKMGKTRRTKMLLKREIDRKQNHPAVLDPSLSFNEPGMTNDGPACRCSPKTKEEGIRHQVFQGETFIKPCNPNSNNADRLYHYVLHVNEAVNPPHNRFSFVKVNNRTFTFKGFSVFFHRRLHDVLPKTPISRWNTEIEFEFIEEPVPENFTVGELEAWSSYLFDYIFEFYDFQRFPKKAEHSGCPVYHVMPRYTSLADGIPTMLTMAQVINYFKDSFRPLMSPFEAIEQMRSPTELWEKYKNQTRHMLVINPWKRPCSIRIDTLTRKTGDKFPMIHHVSARCSAYISVNLSDQQALQKKLNKLRKAMRMKKTPLKKEMEEIEKYQRKIDVLKNQNAALRTLQVIVPAEKFYKTGFFADMASHALTLSLACFHARLHMSFQKLEARLNYKFKNRSLLELAMTHSSFKQNFGIISDHARNALLTCGYKRQFKYEKVEDIKKLGGGPRMAENLHGALRVKCNQVVHNERLEYLGDAVLEMVVTNRLFFLLPHHQEGPLASYRSAIVQNRNLASLAENIGLQHFLLFTHGPDLCHEQDLRHALANAFEAVMGAIFLDSNLGEADRFFSMSMFGHDPEVKQRWENLNEHELKREHPNGDRHMVPRVVFLQKLTTLEESIGYQFKWIRILAKAFTRRSIPFNEITRGHNQRLEWLGDTVVQLVVSEYLYRHFPYHHEGHLSLLRTCIVSNKTQSVICDELNLSRFVFRRPNQSEAHHQLKLKDKADLVESLLGAIFVDGGYHYCEKFIKILFLPRLKYFLVMKRWSDEKSQLQHACLAFRKAGEQKPECPKYRMLSQCGPTNSRIYTVGVFFRRKKLAEGTASTLHAAEMEAARNGLAAMKDFLEDTYQEHKTPQKSSGSAHPNKNNGNIPSLMSVGVPKNSRIHPHSHSGQKRSYQSTYTCHSMPQMSSNLLSIGCPYLPVHNGTQNGIKRDTPLPMMPSNILPSMLPSHGIIVPPSRSPMLNQNPMIPPLVIPPSGMLITNNRPQSLNYQRQYQRR